MPKLFAANARERGQVLAGVIMLMLVILIMVPALVQWVQIDAKASVKNQKTTTAFNLAEAAVERGMWKLKSSTSTFAQVQNGGAGLTGYSFDTTYTDVSGSYRISLTSTTYLGSAAVTVWGEGRDTSKGERRSVQAVYQNLSIPGAIISAGNLNDLSGSSVHRGPIMSLGNINSYAAATYPRKLAKQVVLPFDANGLTPPNTDNQMWWSGYDVPELPIFDFTALRSSATNTGTLNCNGTTNGHANIPCGSACINCVVTNFYNDPRFDSNDVWYWDNNVVINDSGTNGTFIVRGNLVSNGGDWYGNNGGEPLGHSVNMHVPATAWMEYQKFDTTAKNQYPGDNGLRDVRPNYILGSDTAVEGAASGGDLAFFGFLYVGGNLTIGGDADTYGAVWVVGVSTFGSAASANNDVFFNDQLVLPTLNVVLVRDSWMEVPPSKTGLALIR